MNIADVVTKQGYKEMAKAASPKSKVLSNCIKAFFSGGAICAIGQGITNLFANWGFSLENQGMYTSIVLIFIAALLTGLGVYEKIGKYCGAGSVVPITGFANSIAAPAIEFKKDGFVFGVGAKMFLVAGPVIVYGTLTSVLVGIIYYWLG